MEHYTAHNMYGEEDDNSFASFVNSTQSQLVGDVSGDNCHDTQGDLPKPGEQPGQEEQATDFNTAAITASHTRLIIKAVQGLVMNPEEDENTESAGKDNEFGDGTVSLTINVEPGVNNSADEQQQ